MAIKEEVQREAAKFVPTESRDGWYAAQRELPDRSMVFFMAPTRKGLDAKIIGWVEDQFRRKDRGQLAS